MIDPLGGKPAVLIAHALGAVEGVTYSNSEAAFRHSIHCGFRILEADLALTSDRRVVLFHHKKPETESEVGWRDRRAHQLSWWELSQKQYLGRYPVLDVESFVDLVREHPETKIVLDIKTINKAKVLRARQDNEIGFINSLVLKFYKKSGSNPGVAAQGIFRLFGWSVTNRIHPHKEIIGELISMCDEKMLDRLIPQVGRDSVDAVDGLYPFPVKIWKPTVETTDRAFALAEEKGCRYISLHESRVSVRELQLGRHHNVEILVYGTDSEDRIRELSSGGVSGFYVDSMKNMESATI